MRGAVLETLTRNLPDAAGGAPLKGFVEVEAVRVPLDVPACCRNPAVEVIGADPDRAVVRVIRRAFARDGKVCRRAERIYVRTEWPLGEGENIMPLSGKRNSMRLAPGPAWEVDNVTLETEIRHAETSRSFSPRSSPQRHEGTKGPRSARRS